MSIIVTGGAGYIGSHACKYLKKAGYNPICIDNLSLGHEDAVKWGPLIKIDLQDKEGLRETFKKFNPIVAVMHFAAYSYVGESIFHPEKYYLNNVYSTLCLLEEMKKANIKNIIFSSTCATYGIPKELPIIETTSKCPINPYGNSKLMIEKILKDYKRAYGINYSILRYFNAAGADFDSEIGENHINETHLIPNVFNSIIEGKEISIFGTDYDTKDKTAVRDYIHVYDLIKAHIDALNYNLKENTTLELNLGSGNGYSVYEIIENIKNITKKDVKINIEKRREGDPPILYADIVKARKMINFNPKYSDLESIIQSAWKWHKKLKKYR